MSEIQKEIKEIKFMLEKIEDIIDSRLIGIEDPEDDEIEAIKDFNKRKKAGELKLHEI